MRLSAIEQSVIINAIKLQDGGAAVYLFGSRTDDRAKGGDIDILIISDKIKLTEKIKIRASIFNTILEQKLDLVVKKDFQDPFVQYLNHYLRVDMAIT